MAKRRIHLTESQLYGLIRKAINEDYNGGLDWKTLYNAGTKAWQRGDRDRMYKFGTAARDALAKKHNMRKIPYGWLAKGGTIDDSEPMDSEVDMSYQWEDTGYAPSVSAHIRKYDQDEWDKWRDKAKQEVDKYGYVASSPKQSSYRGTVSGGIAYGDTSLETPEFNDVDNFVNGRSQYIKGKGWNESVVRRVTESVMRKLREDFDEDGKQFADLLRRAYGQIQRILSAIQEFSRRGTIRTIQVDQNNMMQANALLEKLCAYVGVGLQGSTSPDFMGVEDEKLFDVVRNAFSVAWEAIDEAIRVAPLSEYEEEEDFDDEDSVIYQMLQKILSKLEYVAQKW